MLAKLEDYGLAVRLKRIEVPMLELLADPRFTESSERSLMSDALESSVQIKGSDKPKL